MVTKENFRKLALSFPEAIEAPHFENTSFRIKKKIFATLSDKEDRACIKLSPEDQSVFCLFDKEIIFPVPNKWGKQGWTLINLHKIKEEMLLDALTTAFCQIAPQKLSETIRNKNDNEI